MRKAQCRQLALALLAVEAKDFAIPEKFYDWFTDHTIEKIEKEMERIGQELRDQSGVRDDETWLDFVIRLQSATPVADLEG